MAALPGVWRYRVSAGTVWPGVSILCLSEVESLICSFCLSVAAYKIVFTDRSLRYTSMLLGCSATHQQQALVMEVTVTVLPWPVTRPVWSTAHLSTPSAMDASCGLVSLGQLARVVHLILLDMMRHFRGFAGLPWCATFVALPVRHDAPLSWLCWSAMMRHFRGFAGPPWCATFMALLVRHDAPLSWLCWSAMMRHFHGFAGPPWCTTFMALLVRHDAPLSWLCWSAMMPHFRGFGGPPWCATFVALHMSHCEGCKCKWESFMTNQNICCDSVLASSVLADAESEFWIRFFYKESLLQKAVPLYAIILEHAFHYMSCQEG